MRVIGVGVQPGQASEGSWQQAEGRKTMRRVRVAQRILVGLAFIVTLLIPAIPSRCDEDVYQLGAVAADHALASEAGVEILKQGGNIVDAAAAVGFALSVLRPASSGIGGGGFMLICDAKEQRCIVLDYRERAPLRATAEMFVEDAKKSDDDEQSVPNRSVRGPLAAAVPGHVAGLCHAVEKHGRLPIAEVVAPAIRLARSGVPADAHFVKTRKSAMATWSKWPKDFRDQFMDFHNSYLLTGKSIKEGDIVTSPQLPALEQIAARGAAGFYAGPVVESLL